MDHQDMIAYCGIYCELCSFRTAYETQDRAHVLATPTHYDRMKDMPLSEFGCKGCKQDNFCGDCAMRDCASKMGYISCADCDAFPCEHTDKFTHDHSPHHAQAIANLHRIQAIGYPAWLGEMEKLVRCSCGARQSWYLQCQAHAQE